MLVLKLQKYFRIFETIISSKLSQQKQLGWYLSVIKKKKNAFLLLLVIFRINEYAPAFQAMKLQCL